MTYGRAPVLTIDGPAGAGKGTVGQRCALELGWHYLDSGALYRVAGLVALEHALGVEDVDEVVRRLEDLNIAIYPQTDAAARVTVDGLDVTEQLRMPETGGVASRFARLPVVREALSSRQQGARQAPRLVADGRDMGTVVFPDAVLKVYLTASTEERARRRYKQLKDKGLDVNLARLVEELAERDRRDRERETAPLTAADDALVLDSTCLDIEQVVNEVLELVQARCASAPATRCGSREARRP